MHVKRPVKTESLRGLFWAKKYRLREQLHWRSDKGPNDPSADGFSPQSHLISVGTIRPPWHHHSRIYGLKRLLQEPKVVTVLVRVVWRMVQHLQGHSVQRVLRSDYDMETGVGM